MPAEGASSSATVADSEWMSAGMVVYVENLGHMQVAAVTSSPFTSVSLTNLEDTATSAYTSNSAPGTIAATSSKISPAGLQGPDGDTAGNAPDSASYITVNAEASLSGESAVSAMAAPGAGTYGDVLEDQSGTMVKRAIGVAHENSVTVDDAAGLTTGLVVTATANGIETPTAATARTALGLGSAATASTGAANGNVVLVDDAGGLSNGRIAFATASGIESKTSANETTAIVLAGGYGLLGESLGVDLDNGGTVPADVATITMPGGRYRIDKITWQGSSAAIGTAAVGIYTGAGATGTR